MNESVSFRKVNYPFLNMIKKDIQKVNSSENVFKFADKTRNLYEASPSTYNKLLTENITKSYKAGTEDIIDSINVELKDIANSIGVGNRIDVMAKIVIITIIIIIIIICV